MPAPFETSAQRFRQLSGTEPARAAYDRAYGRSVRDPNDPRRTARWQRLRALVLRKQPVCADCESRDITRPAKQVDHVQPIETRPDLAFVEANLRALCSGCHARKSAAERKAKRERERA